jgi:hypothetical protein
LGSGAGEEVDELFSYLFGPVAKMEIDEVGEYFVFYFFLFGKDEDADVGERFFGPLELKLV